MHWDDCQCGIVGNGLGYLIELFQCTQGQIDKNPPLAGKLAGASAGAAQPFLADSIAEVLGDA